MAWTREYFAPMDKKMKNNIPQKVMPPVSNFIQGKNIAYIVQMKAGLNRFIYREINALHNSGINVILFPLKYSKGPYMPDASWKVYSPTPLKVLTCSMTSFIKHPFRTLSLLKESLFLHSYIDLLIAFYFSSEMEKNNVTHIHCHFADHKLFIGYYCKKILNTPLFVTVHAYELYNNPNRSMLIKSLKDCERIITISKYNKRILTDEFGVEDSKILVNYLFVEDIDNSADKTKILIVGRYVEKKGHDTLFHALKQLGREDVVLWVAGIGDDSQIKKMASDLGVEKKIVFFGEVSDATLNILYRYCDIFCLPSKSTPNGGSEGIPVALMEAMAYCKPIISTKHAGIPELVENFLIEENDVNHLTEILNKLIDNKELRLREGVKNQNIVQERFSEKNLEALKKLFGDTSYGT